MTGIYNFSINFAFLVLFISLSGISFVYIICLIFDKILIFYLHKN